MKTNKKKKISQKEDCRFNLGNLSAIQEGFLFFNTPKNNMF
jgi:hypothetical protein